MIFSALDHLECARCGTRYDADRLANTCPCDSPLLARYDLDAARVGLTREAVAGREPALWRWHELLPVRDPRSVVSLGEATTPLLPLRRLGAAYDVPRLLLKDDGLLPTGSFKARGAAVGVSRAAELGVRAVAMPTNGNAGAAWSAYAARAGMRCFVAVPRAAPPVHRAECELAGAEVAVVDGLIGDAARVSGAVVADRGHFDAATLREPYRIEGKKTIGFELVEQLGWRLPDVVVCPTGGGVAIIGIHKALEELAALGLIGGPLPRLVAVQAAGCAPLVRAFRAGAAVSEPWPDAATIAFGIAVPKAYGDFLVLRALGRTGGTAVAVDDGDLLATRAQCARTEGLLVCPEAAAALAAVRHLRERGEFGADDEVVVLNTGSGLKDLSVLRDPVPRPA